MDEKRKKQCILRRFWREIVPFWGLFGLNALQSGGLQHVGCWWPGVGGGIGRGAVFGEG
jgi:hypothetical protein